MSASTRPLGRNKPTDYDHIAAKPASVIIPSLAVPTPVVAGSDWLTGFDAPIEGTDGKWRVPQPGAAGTVRGGHCYCFEPEGEPDKERAWIFYNQGEEGACEGFGNSRALTLLSDGELFDAFWLYDDARREENTYPSGEGSTNLATAEALKRWGDHPAADDEHPLAEEIERVPWTENIPSVSIEDFHWATNVEEIRTALGYDTTISEFPFLNSWGKEDYPHRVYMADTMIDALLKDGAEYTVLVRA